MSRSGDAVARAATLFDLRMHDGSRHFFSLPESRSWGSLRRHLAALDGVEVTAFVPDRVIEMWLDFRFAGHEFSVNHQIGEYGFFVRNPACPDNVLLRVARHGQELLDPRR